MSLVLDETAEAFLTAANPDPSPLLNEMTEYGEEQNFPTVGPDAGRFLRLVATLAGAERIFEFGSGFGYSAAWFLGALPADGEIVLTDYDDENLEDAREFLGRLDHDADVHFESGDALETFERYDGPFDVIFLDHDKERYVEAFDLAVKKLAPGGVVLADNMMAGPVQTDDVTATLDGAPAPDDTTEGVAAYVEHVRDHSDFETAFVPLGEGVAVSVENGT